MSDRIRVMVVDDLRETRESVHKLLQFDNSIEIVGEAENGEMAVAKAVELKPDVILMDVNMPDMDGITATKKIMSRVPTAQIIIMSVQSDTPYIRRAMNAGARDFLTKPFSLDELSPAIHEVYKRRPQLVMTPEAAPQAGGAGPARVAAQPGREGKVVAVYSPKGGVGCTTLATNMAAAIARAGQKTALVDGCLQFGTLSVMLNIKGPTTILDLADRLQDLDADLLSSVMHQSKAGMDVLLAPPKPEMSELVQPEHMAEILDYLRRSYDFVIVDVPSSLDDITLTVLDRCQAIVLVLEQSLPSLKTCRDFINLADGLGYDIDKIMLTVNRADKRRRIGVNDIAKILKRRVAFTVPDDPGSVNNAADRGHTLVPLRVGKLAVADAMNQMGLRIMAELSDGEMPAQIEKKRSLLSRLFGRG